MRKFALLALVPLFACHPANEHDLLAKGEVVSLGKEHLIVKDGSHVMFLSVDEVTKRSLQGLKRGDSITMFGRKEMVEATPGQRSQSSEVYAIMKDDGTRIALR